MPESVKSTQFSLTLTLFGDAVQRNTAIALTNSTFASSCLGSCSVSSTPTHTVISTMVIYVVLRTGAGHPPAAISQSGQQ